MRSPSVRFVGFVVIFVLTLILIYRHFGGNDFDASQEEDEILQLAAEQEQLIRAEGDIRLSDLDSIMAANRDPLPKSSAFGLKKFGDICIGNDSWNCWPEYRSMETRMRFSALFAVLPAALRAAAQLLGIIHRQFQTSPKYNLSACIIQKSMSTVLSAVMCYLYDEKAFTEAGRSFRFEYTKERFCRGINEYNNLRKSILGFRPKSDLNTTELMKEWTVFAVIREPVERFLSGYVDKCIRFPTQVDYCNGCGSNMTCFVLTEYERIRKQVRSEILFRTFEDRHFAPQSWQVSSRSVEGMFRRCGFRAALKSYTLLRHSSSQDEFLQRLFQLLRGANVPESSIHYISEQIRNQRTVQSTVATDARRFFDERLRTSPFLMEYIVRMFYYDFVHFDYPIPQLEFE